MKKFLTTTLVLSSFLFAGGKILGNYEEGTPPDATYIKADQKISSFFPVKENATRKYLYDPLNDKYLLYVNGKLNSVNSILIGQQPLSTAAINIKKELMMDGKFRFVGAKTVIIDRNKGLVKSFTEKTENEVSEIYKKLSSELSPEKINVYTLVYESPFRQAILIYAQEYVKPKKCIQCEYVNGEDVYSKKYKEQDTVVTIFYRKHNK